MDNKAALGGIAAIIVALTGLLTFAYQNHLLGLNESPTTPTQTATPTASVSSSASSLLISEVFLRADPFDYSGTCPIRIILSGRVSVSRGSGTVSYRFIRSDGASAPVQTANFTGPGSMDVTDTWQLGGPGFTYAGWEAIRLLDPQQVESAHATFRVVCH